MNLKFGSKEGRWWEFLMGFKWPHQGFTLGYDLIGPNDQPQEDEMTYFAVLFYLGPITLIFNWGNHQWDN
jgi:hypothetical protein